MKLILVVEDHADTRSALVKLLRLEGYDPIGVESAEQAILFTRDHMPAAIVLDLMLPGMSGLQFLEYLRSDVRAMHIPVVAASAADGLRDAALKAGANAFVVKGVAEWADFRKALAAVIESSRMQFPAIEER